MFDNKINEHKAKCRRRNRKCFQRFYIYYQIKHPKARSIESYYPKNKINQYC